MKQEELRTETIIRERKVNGNRGSNRITDVLW